MSTTQEQRAFIEAMFRLGKPNFAHIRLREGVTKGEFFMLGVLHDHKTKHPEAKGMYVSELAELLQVTPPAVSRMLRGMEGKDYLERVVDRADRRTTYIVLRPEGERTRREMEAGALTFAGRIIDRMGAEDTAVLLSLWGRLADIISEEQQRGDSAC